MPIIPELRKLEQKNHELGASLGYTVRPCLQKKRRTDRNHLQEYLKPRNEILLNID